METRKTPREQRESAREQTLGRRLLLCGNLLADAESAINYWFAFDLIDAARVIFGREHDSEFDRLSKAARTRAIRMQDAAIAKNAALPRPLATACDVLAPEGSVDLVDRVMGALMPAGLDREENIGAPSKALPPGHPSHDMVRRGLEDTRVRHE